MVVRMPEDSFMHNSGIWGRAEEAASTAGSNGASQSCEENMWEDGNR